MQFYSLFIFFFFSFSLSDPINLHRCSYGDDYCLYIWYIYMVNTSLCWSMMISSFRPCRLHVSSRGRFSRIYTKPVLLLSP